MVMFSGLHSATCPGRLLHQTRLHPGRLHVNPYIRPDHFAVLERRQRNVLARAEKNGDRFLAGFIVGGVVGGLLGWIFAPQISNLLLDENDKLRLPAFLEPDDKELDPEKMRQELHKKMENLTNEVDTALASVRDNPKTTVPSGYDGVPRVG